MSRGKPYRRWERSRSSYGVLPKPVSWTQICEDAICDHQQQIEKYKRWLKIIELNPGWSPGSGYWMEKERKGELKLP